MKTKMYENYEIYEAPTAEVHDLEVELVYLEDGGASGGGPDVPGEEW